MSDPWWKKITSYVQGNGKTNPLILTISHDPVIEESLGEALGEAMDLVFSDGQHSMDSIRQHGRPSLIIGDARLIVNSPFGRELRDSEWREIPLLAIAEDTGQLSQENLQRLGAVEQIKNPYDIVEIKEKVTKFMVTGITEDGTGEAPDAVDTPTQVIEPRSQLLARAETASPGEGSPEQSLPEPESSRIPSAARKELPRDKNLDTELDTLLAEINKGHDIKEKPSATPADGFSTLTDRLEEIEALTENPAAPGYGEFEAFSEENKISVEPEVEPPSTESDKHAGYEEESTPGGKEMFNKSLSDEPPNIERKPAFNPAPSPQFSDSIAPGMEAWLRQIIEEKVSQIISQAELSKIVEKVARESVPQIAAERVNQEIERIKQKIQED